MNEILIDMVAGGIGGASLVCVGYPLDTIKVRIQTAEVTRSHAKVSVIDCAKQIYRRGGLKGFYKGMTSPLCSVIPMYACSFLGYSLGRKVFLKKSQEENLQVDSVEMFARVA